MDKIGLITVLYNSDTVLDGFLESVANQINCNYHLYMVDNSVNETSTLLIYQLLKKHNIEHMVTYLPNDKNYGVAKGNNIGINQAMQDGCDYFLILNNDIEFYQDNIFSELLSVSNNMQQPIVVPKIRYYKSNLIWFAGCIFHKRIANPIHIGFREEDKGQFDELVVYQSAPTCFILIHRYVFEKVGLMDEKYFVYMDDIDFFYRCSLKGIGIQYYPQIIIEHKESISTGGRTSDFTFYYTFRNRLFFVDKFYNTLDSLVSKSYILGAYFIKAVIYRKLSVFNNAYRDYLNMKL